MTNTALLDEYIKKSGYKKDYICDAIGITRPAFLKKRTNKAEFKASEIETLCKLLNISVGKRMEIFFATKVD